MEVKIIKTKDGRERTLTPLEVERYKCGSAEIERIEFTPGKTWWRVWSTVLFCRFFRTIEEAVEYVYSHTEEDANRTEYSKSNEQDIKVI